MEQIVVEFETTGNFDKESLKKEFEDQVIVESSAFSGTEIITVLISTSAIILDRILNYFIQNRKTLKETKIRIGNGEIEISGFSDEEIRKMIESGSFEKLKKIVYPDDEQLQS